MKTLFKRIFILILLTSTTALIIYYALAPHPILVEMQQVRRGTFHEIIRTDGILRSKESYIISAFAEGDIKRIDLKVGDRIKKGQSITEIFWDMKYEPLS
ncbi:efflux RND transporter periplasmic adaptor subunit, partial [bacterium]|nr:efflux RND transporter periplasmic adaptor subunit [bacterium]